MKKALQRIIWRYFVKVFAIYKPITIPASPLRIEPITKENAGRVEEFRDWWRAREYRDKLAKGEVGFFAMDGRRLVGSIWATINRTPATRIARGYMRLRPGEALIHDIVTADAYRGRGAGGFMTASMIAFLFQESSRVIIDVNVHNYASLRMMEKLGLHAQTQELFVSLFRRPVFHLKTECVDEWDEPAFWASESQHL